MRRLLSERRRARFSADYRAAASDIRLQRQIRATQTTLDYIETHLPTVQSVDSWQKLHELAVAHASLNEGLILEFGVFSGTTINFLAERFSGRIDGFDSFEGLPDDWRDGYPKGTFARKTPPDVAANVALHVGWFADTLPDFLQNHAIPDQPVRYLHMDGDLYSSARTVLDLLAGRLVPGSVLVFDEYFNYAGWQQGEFKAFQEAVQAQGLRYEYLTYNYRHQQVAVKLV